MTSQILSTFRPFQEVRKWRPTLLDLSDRADFGVFAFLYTLFWPDAARRFRSAVGAKLRIVPVRRPTVVAESRWPSTSYLTYLVGGLGYPGVAASAAFSNWLRGLPDKRHIAACPDPDDGLHEFEYQVLPGQPVYLPAPTIPTTRWGFNPKTVVEVIGRHRWSDALSNSVFRVVYLRQQPHTVAEQMSVNLGTLYTYCSAVRDELRALLKDKIAT
jgi:hypothetical protein